MKNYSWVYRDHRGGLKESIATLKKFGNLFEMLEYISNKYHCYIENISISLYDKRPDERIGWKLTYLVCISGDVFGFCSDNF